MNWQRLVLPGLGNRDRFHDAAFGRGWLITSVIEADGLTPYQEMWEASLSSAVQLVEDDMLGVTLLIISGSGVGELASGLAADLPVVDPIEVTLDVLASTDPEALGVLLPLLGPSAPRSTDPSVLAAFRSSLATADAVIRQVALMSLSYLDWPEAQPILRETERNDPEPALRDLAGTLLEVVRRRELS